jgi:hypothetical protein
MNSRGFPVEHPRPRHDRCNSLFLVQVAARLRREKLRRCPQIATGDLEDRILRQDDNYLGVSFITVPPVELLEL